MRLNGRELQSVVCTPVRGKQQLPAADLGATRVRWGPGSGQTPHHISTKGRCGVCARRARGSLPGGGGTMRGFVGRDAAAGPWKRFTPAL